MTMQKVPIRSRMTIPDFIRHLILAWLLAAMTEYLILPSKLRDLGGLEGLAQMSLLRVLAITGCTAILLAGSAVCFGVRAGVRWGVMAAFAMYAVAALLASFSWAFFLFCMLVLVVLVGFGCRGWDNSPETVPAPKPSNRMHRWMTAGFSAAFFLLVSAWSVGRVYSFCVPSYDFGIFAQMFYSMKETGLPMTTLERDGLLSHFAVHVSPVYYLMLPFYCLAPTPATLQVLQAAVITSAVIPLWKLCKYRGLTGGQRMLVCVILLLYPALAGGTGYDLHENCFLTLLLLWLFYGIDRKNTALTAIAAMLVLTVKEDAAVYVAVIGLWLTVKTVLRFPKLDRQNLVTGVLLLTISLGWFFLVTGYLAKNGDGVMTYRYNNFYYDGSSSLFTVIKSVILCPMKVICECVDTEKLSFLALTLLPLLGLPLLTRRYERYILLIPYVLVNLMSDYPYQHDIFFQYSFGSTAFLVYLTVVNLADLKMERKRLIALWAAFAVSAACFAGVIIPQAVRYPVLAAQYHGYYQNIRDILDTIPDDASVAATTFYTTHLSERETLYDIRYCSREHLLEAEYVVLKLSESGDYRQYATGGAENGLENVMKLLQSHGYTQYRVLDNVLVIYRKT